jgi:ferredoxin
VPEDQFLNMCIRCGQCIRVCPDQVLHPTSIRDQGIKGMWTPHAVYSWAGCEDNCNFCGQTCPTGAIRALPIEEKRCAAMGVALVRKNICLPHAGIDHCDICTNECESAGYKAISYVRVHARLSDDDVRRDEGYLAPEVDPVKCVGCGRCENRCYLAYVKGDSRMTKPAIFVQPAPARIQVGAATVEEGGEMRLAPPNSYKKEMDRRLKEQKSRNDRNLKKWFYCLT